VLERARIEPYVGPQGCSLLPTIESGAPVRERVLIKYDHQAPNLYSKLPPRVHTAIHNHRRLSAFDTSGGGELYDLANDPSERQRGLSFEQLCLAGIEHIDRLPVLTRRA